MSYTIEKVYLPSNGMLEGIPREVSIRSMKTSEEKLLLGSTGDTGLDAVIKACIQEPTDLDFDSLTVSDKYYLLLKLRAISYGADYKIEYKCPYCGKVSKFTINLDELAVSVLPEGFVDPYDEFKLPVAGNEITLTIPRARDLDDLAFKIKKYNRTFPEAKGDISVIFNLAVNIKEVDGKALSQNDMIKFLSELSVKDSSYIRHRVSKLKLGVENFKETCTNTRCREDLEFTLPVSLDFFRTQYDD